MDCTRIKDDEAKRPPMPDAESAYRKTQNPDYMREKEQETGD